MKKYIDHPHVKKFQDNDVEIDILDNNYDEEKVSHFKKEEEFDIIRNMMSNKTLIAAIERITDFTETESGKFYCLNQDKLFSFIESKFDKLVKTVAEDEGGIDAKVSLDIKKRTGEIIYNELKSPIIGYSFLIKVIFALTKSYKEVGTTRQIAMSPVPLS